MHTEQVRFASGMNFFLGLWLFFAPFSLGYTFSRIATLESLIVGAIVTVIAVLRLAHPERARWASFINLLLGVLLIGSAFVLGAYGVDAAQWDNLTIGIPLAGFALWSLLAVVRPGEE